MKIVVADKGRAFRFMLPNFLFLNRVGLKIIQKQNGGTFFEGINPKCMRKLRKSVRQMKKLHKNWCLVEVEENGEMIVRIKP